MRNYVLECVGALNLAFLAYFSSNRESGASFKLLLSCGLFPAYNFIKMYWCLLVYSVSMLYPVRGTYVLRLSKWQLFFYLRICWLCLCLLLRMLMLFEYSLVMVKNAGLIERPLSLSANLFEPLIMQIVMNAVTICGWDIQDLDFQQGKANIFISYRFFDPCWFEYELNLAEMRL